MGYDTRFFGPSAWQLFHLIAFFGPSPKELLMMIKDILPCKYCRASSREFIAKLGVPGKDTGKWLYDLHNMVNDKLRKQSREDPSVKDPGPDPSFEDVKKHYTDIHSKKPTAVPGRDFLFTIAANFGDAGDPGPEVRSIHTAFWRELGQNYPFEELRSIVAKAGEPDLTDRKSYMRWTYNVLTKLSKQVKAHMSSYNGYAQHVAYYKSGCEKKTYRGKTCRKIDGGGRTKDRDHRKTYRVTHRNLL